MIDQNTNINHIAQESSQTERVSSLDNEPLLTVEEVAQYLRLKPGTVRSLAREKKIPALKVGKSWRFQKSKIMQNLSS